jgi:hypothetical protein
LRQLGITAAGDRISSIVSLLFAKLSTNEFPRSPEETAGATRHYPL